MPNRMSRNWAHLFASAGISTPGAGDRLVDLLAVYKTERGLNDLVGKTVAAVIGNLSITDTGPVEDATNIPHRIAMAITVMTKDTTTLTDIPVPGNDTWPWMWYYEEQIVPQARHVDGVAAAEVFRNITRVYEVHIRSMRKLTMNSSLMMKIHNFSSTAVQFGFGGNCLLLG